MIDFTAIDLDMVQTIGFYALFGLIMFVFSPFYTAYLAHKKGRDALAWFFIGLIFPIVSSLALGFMADLKKEREKRRDRY